MAQTTLQLHTTLTGFSAVYRLNKWLLVKDSQQYNKAPITLG